MSMEPEGITGEEYIPPTEKEYLDDCVVKYARIISIIQDRIVEEHRVEAARLLADKLISPYHFYKENHKQVWFEKWRLAQRRRKSEGKGTQEASGSERAPVSSKPAGRPDTSDVITDPHDDNPRAPDKPEASPKYVNMPEFRPRTGRPLELEPVCPKCGRVMYDNRQDKADGKKPETYPDFKCTDYKGSKACKHAIWLKTEEEVGSAARARKEAEERLRGNGK